MDAQAVLTTARSGAAPSSWYVWPLRRDHVLRSTLAWAAVALVGFVLFIPACIVSLPSFPLRHAAGIIFTTVILVLLGAVAFGGAGLSIFDFYRLRHADDYWLILTPDEFVKAEPGKLVHVPLEQVGDIMMRGVKVPEDDRESTNSLIRSGAVGNLLGTARLKREPKTAPSLSFLDRRTDKSVVVCTDESFENFIALEQILSDTVRAKQRRDTA